jgi:transposase-like protein
MTLNIAPEKLTKGKQPIAARDQAIIAAHASGMMLKDIAELVGLTPNGILSACRRLGLGKRPRSKYSVEMRDQIVADYNARMSYADIAKKHGLKTRNQVVGILHREGVLRCEPRLKKPKKTAQRKTRSTLQLRSPKVKAAPFKERVAPVTPLNIPFLDRRADQCSYLYGDDPKTMLCCGHETYGTTSWCLGHLQICFERYAR